MEVKSKIYDQRISSENILIQTSIGEYTDLVRDVVDNNPYQRKRVTSSKTVYSVLKDDIKRGCVIPPIVLALSMDGGNGGEGFHRDDEIIDAISGRRDRLLILDGLQRTHTLLDIVSEADAQDIARIRELPIRIEVYFGLNKIGILYRMLTLNTGQTPMSLRQQIEMLYLDFLDVGVGDVRFIREVDSERTVRVSEFNFKEVIEGFNSYLERNEQPLERSDILENIKSLEKLSHENNNKDLFSEYVGALYAFISKVESMLAGVLLEDDDVQGLTVWGKDARRCFKKAQVFSGFGAAVGKLKDHKVIVDLDDVVKGCAELTMNDDGKEFLISLNGALDWIAKNTKKIGNAQRMFFQFYFREVFNSESDSYLNLHESIEGAMYKVRTQLF